MKGSEEQGAKSHFQSHFQKKLFMVFNQKKNSMYFK